ncbi:hypothetical protein ON010_g7463 [Phytophthora cinnamomi]|nr:hypothetical protein ON010_g7463 [Phytophthora cinnamomi]
MRLSYVLLATAATALLALSNVAAEKVLVSSVAAPEQVTVAHNEGNDRRLLRSHETTTSDEERLSDAKILKLVNQEDGIFSKWKGKGYTSETIRGKLDKYDHGLTVSQLSAIVNRYKSYFE